MTTTAAATTTDEPVEIVVDPMVRQLNMMAELLDTLGKTSKALTAEMKMITRDVNKMRLASAKGSKKREKKVVDPDTPRKLGALEKPVPITDELADFLGIAKGELYSRQFITKSINAFVKENDIQNPENRRYILLESEAGLKLKALLRDPDQPLTFFNIQRYLKVHYPKPEGEEATTETTTKKTPKAKTVDTTVTSVTPETPAEVVPDADTVDEASSSTDTAPKKKVVRKVVKKSA